MTLDETALEVLGLAPIWVRRGHAHGAALEAGEIVEATDGGHAAGVAQAEVALQAGEPPAGVVASTHVESVEVAGAPERVSPPSPQTRVALAAEKPEQPEQPDEPTTAPRVRGASERALGEPEPHGGHASIPVVDVPAVAALDWDALEARVTACESCRLCEKRTNTVFGVGDRNAEWMLIGEAPGENEDKQGEPFVGQAGKLLDSMLRSLSLARGENVYIANVVKCRPPGNRNPEPDEVARCEPYLQRQVALVKPKLIVALGRVAAQNLLKTDASISSLRGRVHQYEGVPVIVTYHPAYLLRSLPEKAKAWADLCFAVDTYRQALADRTAE